MKQHIIPLKALVSQNKLEQYCQLLNYSKDELNKQYKKDKDTLLTVPEWACEKLGFILRI